MHRYLRALALCMAVAALALPSPAMPMAPVPESYTLVNDQIGLLTIQQKYDLTRKLSDLENLNGVQIILLIVPGTGSEGIENYSLRVMEAWNPGHNGESTAALFAIDAERGSFSIRTGAAIGGALPDVLVHRIWRTHLDPHWRNEEWFKGIDATIDAMIAAISGEQTDPPVWIKSYFITPRGWAGLGLLGIAILYSVFHLTKAWRSRRGRCKA